MRIVTTTNPQEIASKMKATIHRGINPTMTPKNTKSPKGVKANKEESEYWLNRACTKTNIRKS